MTVDLSTIKALTFDVGGTIFDWHHTIRDGHPLADRLLGAAASLADAWGCVCLAKQ